MIVDLVSPAVVDMITTRFGLTYKSGELSGDVVIPDDILLNTDDGDLRRTYDHVLKAYLSTVDAGYGLSIYVPDLNQYSKIGLESRGFKFNDCDVAYIEEITHWTEMRLKYYTKQPSTSITTERVTRLAYEHWPVIPVERRFTYGEMLAMVREKDGCYVRDSGLRVSYNPILQ